MSLYGALYSGVSGLKAQGTSLGVISDNISNLNTVGYKSSKTVFETLVNNSASSVAYNPGGVLASAKMDVSKQGLIQSTDSPTDLAVSGNGFFIVNRESDASGDVLYTRSGSFTQDALGNFRNSAGFYLLGWPLDRNGLLPGEPGNLNTTAYSTIESLQVVNVENANGVAAATTTVEMGANLDAREDVYPGAGRNISMRSTLNQSIASDDVIVPTTTASTAPINTSGIAVGDTLTVTTDQGEIFNFEYGGVHDSGPDIAGGTIFGVTNQSQLFYTAGTAPSGIDAQFIINSTTVGNVTFSYKQTSPNPLNFEFNNMDTLANAINEVDGLSARIVDNGVTVQLYIAGEDANDAITVTNLGVEDFTGEIFGAVSGTTIVAAAGATERFATLQDLADKVNATGSLTATVTSPLADTALNIRLNDPLGTIDFTDDNANGENAAMREFGLIENLDVLDALYQTTFGPEYDPTTATTSMADGAVTPQFTRNIRVFDSLGQGHNLTMGFIRIDKGLGNNIWACEVYEADAGDTNSPSGFGQIAYGNIEFNGDGSLRAITGPLQTPVDIIWTNGASSSSVTFDFGTAGDPSGTVGATQIGLTDGLSMFASDYTVAFVNQNGTEVGSLVGVNVDENGFVIASYNNGQSLRLFKVPLADFANPNGLAAITGNVFSETEVAGTVNLRQASESGVGEIVSGALEASNSELSEQLTNMIVAQRAYQANTKVISTADDLLEELNRI